ncbi:MAG: hypothetical protein HPY50_02205 [Firmicutes bacterium]|nr:hypothetical protein [Bacillota bacterium]
MSLRKCLVLMVLGLAMAVLFSAPVCAAVVAAGTGDSSTTSSGSTDQSTSSGDTNIQKDSQGLPVINTGSGLAPVTEDQVIKKTWRIVGRFYNMAAQIAPQITLAAVVVGVMLGIFIKEAQQIVKWSILGLVLVLWAPQIIAFIINLVNA